MKWSIQPKEWLNRPHTIEVLAEYIQICHPLIHCDFFFYLMYIFFSWCFLDYHLQFSFIFIQSELQILLNI